MGSLKKNRMTTKSPIIAGMMGQGVKYRHEDLIWGVPRPQEYPQSVPLCGGDRGQRQEDLRGLSTC